jgi:DNA repair protein RadD
MQYVLRPYQQEAVDRAVAYLTNPRLTGRNGLIVAPTGSGKSLLVANITTRLDGPSIVFQPTKEILQQNARKLAAYGYQPGLWSASVGRKERGAITLATIGSIVGQAEAFRDVRYILVDEAHYLNPKGGQYAAFLQLLEHARVLGLTATPFRLHSNSYGSMLRFLTRTRPKILHDVVHVTQVRQLLEAGYLVPLEYRLKPTIDPTRLRYNSTGADYTDASVQLAFEEVGFTNRLEQEVRELLAEGRRHILVFTRFVNEARHLALAVPGAAVVTGETPPGERARILEAFESGRVRVVANVAVLTTGYDFPALDTIVLARPTVSLALHYQMIGRAVRPAPGKRCALILDLVGLVKQFGRFEDLVLRADGRNGDLWHFESRGRRLTNEYFGEVSAKRKYFAQRNSPSGDAQQPRPWWRGRRTA